MGKLRGKTALVTGASKGIGRAISVALAGEGARVFLAARSAAGLARTAELVAEAGGAAEVVPTDMAAPAAIGQLAAAVRRQGGRLDVLVNNAGVTYAASMAETSAADWDRVMGVNARGPYLLCRECLEMLKASRGRIINIASVVGVKGYAQQTLYSASKHALRGMSIALAEELRDSGVRVHVVCPGGVDTDMVGAVRPDIPKAALMAPEEVAEMVLYLAAHEGNAVVDEIRMRRAASGPWF